MNFVNQFSSPMNVGDVVEYFQGVNVRPFCIAKYHPNLPLKVPFRDQILDIFGQNIVSFRLVHLHARIGFCMR
jgi:hypothetical protein